MSVVVRDRLPSFSRSAKQVLGDALKDGASDVLVKAKTKAPFKKGQLRSNTDIRALSQLHYRISFWMEYARFQEFGGDSKRRVRNYTTSGTGSKYLKTSGDEVAERIDRTFMMHGRRAK